MHSLGVSESFRFDDVLSLEEGPMSTVSAVIVVFPEVAEDEIRKSAEKSKRDHVLQDNVQFLKQTIDNACVLFAILHCILNTKARDSLSMFS